MILIPYLPEKLLKETLSFSDSLFFLPWNQAVGSLKSCGIQFKKGCDVVSMGNGDQGVHDLLPGLAFLL